MSQIFQCNYTLSKDRQQYKLNQPYERGDLMLLNNQEPSIFWWCKQNENACGSLASNDRLWRSFTWQNQNIQTCTQASTHIQKHVHTLSLQWANLNVKHFLLSSLKMQIINYALAYCWTQKHQGEVDGGGGGGGGWVGGGGREELREEGITPILNKKTNKKYFKNTSICVHFLKTGCTVVKRCNYQIWSDCFSVWLFCPLHPLLYPAVEKASQLG